MIFLDLILSRSYLHILMNSDLSQLSFCPLLSYSVIFHRNLESLGTFLGESCNLERKNLSLCCLHHLKFVTQLQVIAFLSYLLSETEASWHWTWLFSRRKLEVSNWKGEDFFYSSWQMWSKLNIFHHFNLNFLVSMGKGYWGCCSILNSHLIINGRFGNL